jgi:hypothetical protein
MNATCLDCIFAPDESGLSKFYCMKRDRYNAPTEGEICADKRTEPFAEREGTDLDGTVDDLGAAHNQESRSAEGEGIGNSPDPSPVPPAQGQLNLFGGE